MDAVNSRVVIVPFYAGSTTKKRLPRGRKPFSEVGAAGPHLGRQHLGFRHFGLQHLGFRHFGLQHFGLRHFGLQHLGFRHFGLQHLGFRHFGLQHLGLRHFDLQHFGLQHLGLQQRVFRQPHVGSATQVGAAPQP